MHIDGIQPETPRLKKGKVKTMKEKIQCDYLSWENDSCSWTNDMLLLLLTTTD